jgi:hypothetical protein
MTRQTGRAPPMMCDERFAAIFFAQIFYKGV